MICTAKADNGIEEDLTLEIGREILLAAYFIETVEGTTQHQALQTAALHGGDVDALHEVKDVLEGPTRIALLQQSFDSTLAKALDGAQAEADGAGVINAESLTAMVDVGTENIDTERFAFAHQLRNLGDVIEASAHDGRHIFRWEVGFQPCCLVGNP